MTDNAIEEIKSRLDIVEVISEYITLKQAGINFRATCPFHKEKTPSFFVSPERQLWRCFGCSEHGDIFSFVMKMEGLEFPEALRILAKKAGVELQKTDPHVISQKTKLLDICQLAASFFQDSLNSDKGLKTREYLKKRNVSEKSIADFNLGYAPDSWNDLLQFFRKKGFKDSEIESAGLIIKKNQSADYYDRFRNRLMFPISDQHGVIVGFGGRALDENEIAKYLNSPETAVYNKSRLLYAIDKAKMEIKKNNFAILVEGYMDTIASHQAGVTNVVASAGTSLTLDQIKLLKRYTPNVILSFDADSAGQDATKRSIDLLLEQEMNVKIVVVPKGKDPDELIREDPQLWKKTIVGAKRIMDYYFDSVFENLDLDKVESKKKAAKILLPIIAKISDRIEQSHWLQQLGARIKVEEKILREVLGRSKQKITHPHAKEESVEMPKKIQSRNLLMSERFFGLILKGLCLFPKPGDFLSEIINNLFLEQFKDQKLNQLAKDLKVCYSDFNQRQLAFNYQEFKDKLDSESLKNYADLLLFNIEKDFPMLEKTLLEEEISWLVEELKREALLEKLKDVENKLKEAENKKDQETIKNLTQELNILTQELFKLTSKSSS